MATILEVCRFLFFLGGASQSLSWSAGHREAGGGVEPGRRKMADNPGTSPHQHSGGPRTGRKRASGRRTVFCPSPLGCINKLFSPLRPSARETDGVRLRPHSHVQPAGLPAALHAAPARQRPGRGPQRGHVQWDQPPRCHALQPVHPQE